MTSTLRIGHTNRQHYIGVDDVALLPGAPSITAGLLNVAGFVWDTGSLSWVKAQQAGGGAGGSVTVTNFPSVQVISQQPQAFQFDQASSTIAYLGTAVPGTALSASAWAIQQLTFSSSGSVSILWANGVSTANSIWNNRAALSYS
jgi:hypothetical protein